MPSAARAFDHAWGVARCRVLKDSFYQFSWRPRPAGLLSAEAEREILKNLKKYGEKYAVEDAAILDQVPRAPLAVCWLLPSGVLAAAIVACLHAPAERPFPEQHHGPCAVG
jgi:hypothetical protein